jgi:hypothetical protein
MRSAVAACLATGIAAAAPRSVETFDARTWPALQASLDTPAVVVFTTTDCAYCPGVIEQLAGEIRERRLKAPLIAVVLDAAPGEADAQLVADPHYGPADRLMAVSGQVAAVRHSVNPAWRGMTPYVAFLRPGASPAWVLGKPSETAIEAWHRASTGVADKR